MRKVSIIVNVDNDINELLLDKVRAERKKGNKTSKEKLINQILIKNRKELL